MTEFETVQGGYTAAGSLKVVFQFLFLTCTVREGDGT